MSRFTILLGGDLVPTPAVERQVAGSRVIAADSGIRHAKALGLTPELWVGDFDSVSDDLAAEWPDIPREIFPAGKDKTDGELAIDEAFSRGASELVLVGAFGGARADHAFLHMALAIRLAEKGTPVLLTSGAQEGRAVLNGRTAFDYAPATLFSILGFSDLSGLSVEGARWPLHAIEMPFGSSLTISNEVTQNLVVTLKSGRALLVAHPHLPKDA
ncbi:MAG TPA: thiamine diphosphokinase [Rhizobiaceae bacterium]|nr:thiamine diphosphokinase [Rhizobiaceae bacterium]